MRILAYLDLGTGSFLLQVAAGGMFAGMLFVKRFWGQAKEMMNLKARSHHVG